MFLAHEAGEQEGHFQRLLVVQPRVDVRAVGAARSASVRPLAPPMHSVTLSPVSSKCTPPRMRAAARSWISKARLQLAEDVVEARVLMPLRVVIVLPCIGSQHQSDDLALRADSASTSGGRHSLDRARRRSDE